MKKAKEKGFFVLLTPSKPPTSYSDSISVEEDMNICDSAKFSAEKDMQICHFTTVVMSFTVGPQKYPNSVPSPSVN